MNFARLQQLSAVRASSAFAPGVDGRAQHAWFPPTAETQPQARVDFILCLANVTSGPLRARAGDPLQMLLRTEETLTVLLPCPLPYLPSRDKTTFLLGTCLRTAVRYRIAEFRSAPGIMELDAVKISPLA